MTHNAVDYSSADLPEHDRFDIWHEIFARKMVGFEMSHTDQRPFFTEAQFRSFGAVRMARNTSTAMRFVRSRQIISNGDSDFFGLPLCVDGTWEVKQRKRRLAINRQTIALVDLGDVMEGGLHTGFPGNYHTLVSLCLPKEEFLKRAPHTERLLMTPFRSQEGLDLLVNYLGMIDTQSFGRDPSLDQLIGEQIMDIVAFLCRPHKLDTGGVRAARKAALAHYLERHYREPGLSVSDIASALKISRRYLYELLDESEETITKTLNRLRLERARRLLTDPNYQHVSIVEVAFQSGFNDLSYFYRQFRRRFGEAPGAFRLSRTLSNKL
jgi:AraC-like DNA-binding protein